MGEHETQNREFRILKQNSGRLQNQFICFQIFSCQPELQVSASNDTSQSPLTDASVSYSTDPRGRKIVLLHEWLSLRTKTVTGIAFFLFFPHFFLQILEYLVLWYDVFLPKDWSLSFMHLCSVFLLHGLLTETNSQKFSFNHLMTCMWFWRILSLFNNLPYSRTHLILFTCFVWYSFYMCLSWWYKIIRNGMFFLISHYYELDIGFIFFASYYNLLSF